MTQLALDIHIQDSATFERYVVGDNQMLMDVLLALDPARRERNLFLWGPSGTGRTHLLQATCHHRSQNGLSAAYLPLSEYKSLSSEALMGMEGMGLLCLDDVDAVIGHAAWETALFHAYNRCQETDTQLLFAAAKPCNQLTFRLPDLRSRLLAAVALQLQPLSDAQKLTVLQLRAESHGLVLSDASGEFLLHHYTRDIKALFELLDRLDKASLAAQRKITVPFIKSVL